MQNRILCSRCHGSGRYLGNGMIERSCEVCDKTGWVDKKIEIKQDQPLLTLNDVVEESSAPRKRGRPKKVVNG